MTATIDRPATVDGPGTETARHQHLMDEHSAHNYRPLPVVIADGAGAWVTRRRGPPVPGLPRRVLGAELRARPPGTARRGTPPARPRHAHQPGLRQRPDRPVLCGARGARRQADGAADEHRRRGGRERAEGGAQVGLRREGRAGGRGRDRGGGERLPRPHDQRRQLLHRPRGARRLRAVHTRVRRGAVRGRRRAACRHHPAHRRRADRAGAGRGRGRPGTSRVPGRGPRDLHRGAGAVRRRRGAVRARPHRPRARHPRRGRGRRRLPAREGTRRRDHAALGGRRGHRRARGASAGPARQHVRRQPAGLCRRPGGDRPARRRRTRRAARQGRPTWVPCWRTGSRHSSGTAWSPCAGRGCGRGSTSTRGWPPAGRSASGSPCGACSPRTRTARRSGCPHRW